MYTVWLNILIITHMLVFHKSITHSVFLNTVVKILFFATLNLVWIRFQLIIAVIIKVNVFFSVMQYSLVWMRHCFGQTYCYHHNSIRCHTESVAITNGLTSDKTVTFRYIVRMKVFELTYIKPEFISFSYTISINLILDPHWYNLWRDLLYRLYRYYVIWSGRTEILAPHHMLLSFCVWFYRPRF
jgi:hypothetical protein